MFAALILAAGRSERMGRAKALLRQVQSGHTFVGHLIKVSGAAGVDPVLVVGRPHDLELRSTIERAGARFVPNPSADQGQLSSILAGLDAADGAVEGVIVLPVDVPLVSSRVIGAVVAAAGESAAQIVRAAHNGRHGHPVLFKRAVFDELRSADPHIGARAVVRADPARVRDVDVGEAGVTLDIDTPEDYLRIFGRRL